MNSIKALIVFTVLLYGLISCNQPKPDHKKSQYLNKKQEDYLQGKWALCEIVYYEKAKTQSIINFNVCPSITFYKNYLGYIKRSDPHLLYFTWTCKDEKIIFRQRDELIDNIYPNGNYKITFKKNNNVFNEVDLIDTIKCVKYVLGR